jgi:hypothetical protein
LLGSAASTDDINSDRRVAMQLLQALGMASLNSARHFFGNSHQNLMTSSSLLSDWKDYLLITFLFTH